MIDLAIFGLTGYAQFALLIAFALNFSSVRWTVKQVFLATAVSFIPILILVAIFNLGMLFMYIGTLISILALRIVFKMTWRLSTFIGVFINFISIIVDYVYVFALILLPETAHNVVIENLIIIRFLGIVCYIAIYAFSRKYKNREYPPLSHVATVQWIVYISVLTVVADFQLQRMYAVHPTLYYAPEMAILFLFLVFFLHNLFYLGKLSGNITKRLKAEYDLELTKKELVTQEFYNVALKDVLNDLSGFRHEFSNTLNAINGYISQKDLVGLENYMRKHNATIITSAALEIIEPIKHFPVLFGLLSSAIISAHKKEIEFRVAIMCSEPDIKFCSVVDYGMIIGTLLDNAVDAADKSNERSIQFDIMVKHGKLITTIVNSCDEYVDTDRIYERRFSTKDNPSGEGLFQVKRILQRYSDNGHDIQLNTTLENGQFVQELIV